MLTVIAYIVSPDYTQKNLNIFMKEDKELEGRFFSHL